MSRRSVLLVVAVVAVAVGGVAYAAGFVAGRAVPAMSGVQPARATTLAQPVPVPQPMQAPQAVQAQPDQGPSPFQGPPPGQAPPTLREFVPLPQPGDQTPGQRPGQQQGDCEPVILFYHNGQLYQLRPGPGQQDGRGRPGTPPEFYQLNPYQGPPIPGLPFPRQERGPGFTPVNPRS